MDEMSQGIGWPRNGAITEENPVFYALPAGKPLHAVELGLHCRAFVAAIT
jgi:hypothetical protein